MSELAACSCLDEVAGLTGEVCTVQGALDCTNPTGHGTSLKTAPDCTGEMVTVPSLPYSLGRPELYGRDGTGTIGTFLLYN